MSHSPAYMDIVKAVSQFCMRPSGRDLCRSVTYILFGPSHLYFDELLATIINHIPAGASYKQFVHYFQIAATRKLKICNIDLELALRFAMCFIYHFRDFPTLRSRC